MGGRGGRLGFARTLRSASQYVPGPRESLPLLHPTPGLWPKGLNRGSWERDSAKTDLGTVTQQKAAGVLDSARKAQPRAGWGEDYSAGSGALSGPWMGTLRASLPQIPPLYPKPCLVSSPRAELLGGVEPCSGRHSAGTLTNVPGKGLPLSLPGRVLAGLSDGTMSFSPTQGTLGVSLGPVSPS